MALYSLKVNFTFSKYFERSSNMIRGSNRALQHFDSYKNFVDIFAPVVSSLHIYAIWNEIVAYHLSMHVSMHSHRSIAMILSRFDGPREWRIPMRKAKSPALALINARTCPREPISRAAERMRSLSEIGDKDWRSVRTREARNAARIRSRV